MRTASNESDYAIIDTWERPGAILGHDAEIVLVDGMTIEPRT